MKLERAATLDAWADLVTGLLIQRLQRTPTLRMCLPTGLTPVPSTTDWRPPWRAATCHSARATIFLLDEFGGVAPSDPGRCDNMLRRGLLDRLDVPPAQFHGFDLTGDVEHECAAYEAAVGEGCDITLLGIGGNGHIGMNEPGSPPESTTRRVVARGGHGDRQRTVLQSRARPPDMGRHDGRRHDPAIARDLGARDGIGEGGNCGPDAPGPDHPGRAGQPAPRAREHDPVRG